MTIRTALSIASGCLLAACSSHGDDHPKVFTADMLANLDKPAFSNLEIAEAEYVLLDTATDALMARIPDIVGVLGDTIIIHDLTPNGDNSRLLLFDLNDGRYIRTIKHTGEGPGEYRWIQNVMVDSANSQLILLDRKAHVYTTDDRYVRSVDLPQIQNGKVPNGSAKRGLHLTEAKDGNLYIYQLDKNLEPADTITFTDYEPMFISIASNMSDQDVLVNIVDTIYSLYPGGMEEVSVLSRGDKSLTPAVEKEIYADLDDIPGANKKRAKYIHLIYFLDEGPRFWVNYIYDDKLYTDIYSKADGRMVEHAVQEYGNEDSGMRIPVGDHTFRVTQPMLHNGWYYSLVSADETYDPAGQIPEEELNRALIRWRYK